MAHRSDVGGAPPPTRRAVVTGLAGGFGLVSLAGCAAAPAEPPPAAGTPTTASPGSLASSEPATPSSASASPSSTASPSRLLSSDGPDIQAGARTVSAVALTFHGAGSAGLTAAVLQIASTAHAALTVFAVGQWLSANPQLGRDIVGAGHDLGNHTWSHQAMTTLSADVARREVQQGADAVTAAVGQAGLLFRPSGTPSSTPTIRSAATAAGYHRCISYDVDPSDYLDPGADAVRTRTLAAVRGGSIVSLHLGHQGTVDALPGILAGLAARSLTPVTVSELLARS